MDRMRGGNDGVILARNDPNYTRCCIPSYSGQFPSLHSGVPTRCILSDPRESCGFGRPLDKPLRPTHGLVAHAQPTFLSELVVFTLATAEPETDSRP